jgi:hypothetical protein
MGKKKILDLNIYEMEGFRLDGYPSPSVVRHADEQTMPLILSRLEKLDGRDARVNFARIELSREQTEYVVDRLLELSGLGMEFLEKRAKLRSK